MLMDGKGGFVQAGELFGHEGEMVLVPKIPDGFGGNPKLFKGDIEGDRGREVPVGLVGVQQVDAFDPVDSTSLVYDGGVPDAFGLGSGDHLNPITERD